MGVPSVHEHAARLLREHGMRYQRIVSVDRDSILYLNGAGKPMTAWLYPREEKTLIDCVPGFTIWPTRIAAEG